MTDAMTPHQYSTRAPKDRLPLEARSAIGATLAAATSLGPDGRGRLHAPPPLQGWPGIVHGGGLIALFDAAATTLDAIAAPRIVEGRLTSSVPIDAALDFEARADEGAVRLAVLRDGRTLASGTISAIGPDEGSMPPAWSGAAEGWTLPTSEHCLACGAVNPLGLQVEFRFNEDGVWARLSPRRPWREPDGRLHSALGPVLLDEIAWWLGALVMKEGGLTNRIRVTLLTPARSWGAPLIAAGRFDRVAPVDRKGAFLRTETTLMAADGRLCATASIVFRGGGEYSARQMDYFRRRTAPEIFRRMFSNHAG